MASDLPQLPPVRISLVHNPTAGGGQGPDDLVALMVDAGHEVRHRSSKDDWQALLQDPGDLLVAAGGDGTVRKVALAAADVGVPFALVPLGTANNIGKTLGLLGSARTLIDSWSTETAPGPFDMGEANGERFVEALGGGPMAELIARADEISADATLLGRETDRALHLLLELVAREPIRPWRVIADGADLSGAYLAVEVLNIRFAGPNVPFAPDADPGDGLLDVALVREADRHSLLSYLDERLRLASGRLPTLRRVQARSVELEAPKGARLHLDDRLWPWPGPLGRSLAITVRCRPAEARIAGARRGRRSVD